MSSDFSRATDFDSDHQQHSAQTEFAGPSAEAAALPPAMLTAQGRGNAVQRQAAIQRMQQTHGNRAVQRAIALQRSAAAEAAPADDIGARIQARAGGGSALDSGVQRQLEGGMGADLSGVRVHTDGEADHLSRSVDAVAFTTGNDVFFRSGAYNPSSPEGMHLLAHETTHTLQQASGPVAGTPREGGVSVSDPSDSFEQAAEQNAARVTSSMSVGGGGAAVQTMRAGTTAVQRSADDALPIQTMRAGTATVQREAAEEEEPVQTMRAGSMPAVQREAAEEEEPVQTMRAGSMPAVQREAAEEEEPVQAMRVGSMPAVQRCAAEDEQA